MPKRGQTCKCGRHTWNGKCWELTISKEGWTKHCQKCHKFVPDDHALCDFHLREKYGLLDKTIYSLRLYPEDAVLVSLRDAEKRHRSSTEVLSSALLAAQKSERKLLEACKAALTALMMIWRHDACVNRARAILGQAMAKVMDK